jgi:hypothetical protein
MSKLDAKHLRSVLNYDPITGLFVWRKSGAGHRSNFLAGSDKSHQYSRIAVSGHLYYAHRLAWLYMTGEWPPSDIDHINGIKTDNRIRNLRVATRSQNIANSRTATTNSSGFKGVHWEAVRSKWRAQIVVDGKRKWSARFDTPEAAHAAYIDAAVEYFGAFARSG